MQSRRSHAPKRQAPKRTTKSRRVPREGWDESFRLIAIRGDDALRDVAAHIDRERFPERAAEVDDEIKRRAALPIEDQEPVTFGGTLHRGLFYKAVGADLSFSTTELSFEINPIWGVSSFRIGRGDVERVVARTSFFKSGFEF